MSELHDDLERATTALEKETIADYDELVAAWEHILCHPDIPISAPGVRLPVFNNAGIAYLSRYRTIRQLKDLKRALELWQEIVEQDPFDLPERFRFLYVESQLEWPALPHERSLPKEKLLPHDRSYHTEFSSSR